MRVAERKPSIRPGRRTDHEYYGVERLNALTDGLFAIVITLLVLELKLPETTNGQDTLGDLARNYHPFIAWVVSFVAIGRFWVVQHHIFGRIARCHTGTIVLNLLMLGFLSLVPFTAALIGTYKVTEPWSTVLFALNLGAVSVTLGFLAQHVMGEPQLRDADDEPPALERYRQHHLLVLPAVALAAAGLAFIEPYVSIGLLLVEFVVVLAVAVWRPAVMRAT